jgi:hypothetical protein
MCRDCPHWKRNEAFTDHGRWAPCALKPDKVVQDRRMPVGMERQAYVTSETYECREFVREQPR